MMAEQEPLRNDTPADANDPGQLRFWVWLLRVFGAGSSVVFDVLHRYPSPEAVYDALVSGAVPNLPPAVARNVRTYRLSEAEKTVDFCRQNGIALLPLTHPQYPAVLREIPAPPILLNALGNLSLLGRPFTLAAVGTRHPSPYSEKVTRQILGPLCSEHGFVIVSGLAKGIDAIAHQTALDCGSDTVAVVGCGVNVDYPRENRQIRLRIGTSGHGLILSEYLPGTEPIPANYPRRNRILSGIAYATAVFEAASRSGSLITADTAVEQGRQLFCVPPGDLFDPRYAGVIPLIRDGAIPLMHHTDVLDMYYRNFPQCLQVMEGRQRPSAGFVFAAEDGKTVSVNRRLIADSVPSESAQLLQETVAARIAELETERPQETETAQRKPEKRKPAQPQVREFSAPLPDDEESAAVVLYLREHGDTYANDIAAALDMDLSALLSTLTMLELDGLVESLFGKVYRAV